MSDNLQQPTSKASLIKKIISIVVTVVAIPTIVLLGLFVWKDGNWAVISAGVALLAVICFFVVIEKKKTTVQELAVIAIMIALSVASRLVFVAIPGFKPITAMVIIAGIALGGQSGFLCGSLSALISNMYFGQGPWTPMQMMVWGMIGMISGIIFYRKEYKKVNIIGILIMGIIGGIAFSLVMDIWTVFSIEKQFTWERYIAIVGASLPFMAVYAISNVIFLFILSNPMLLQLARIRKKYDIFNI